MQQPDKTLRDLVAPVNPQEYISQEKENFLLDQVDASLEDAVFAGGDPNLGLEDVQILPGAFIATRRCVPLSYAPCSFMLMLSAVTT